MKKLSSEAKKAEWRVWMQELSKHLRPLEGSQPTNSSASERNKHQTTTSTGSSRFRTRSRQSLYGVFKSHVPAWRKEHPEVPHHRPSASLPRNTDSVTSTTPHEGPWESGDEWRRVFSVKRKLTLSSARSIRTNRTSVPALNRTAQKSAFSKLHGLETERGKNKPSCSTLDNNVARGEASRWIFKRSTSNNLGRANEVKRLNIEEQISKMFALWDSDKLGKIAVEELVAGLTAIGLGASPRFTQLVVASAFAVKSEHDLIRFEDFRRLCTAESNRSRIIRLLDEQAVALAHAMGSSSGVQKHRPSLRLATRISCLRESSRNSYMQNSAASNNKAEQEKEKDIMSQRRRAIIKVPEEVTSGCKAKDLCHSKAIAEIMFRSTMIEQRIQARNEVKKLDKQFLMRAVKDDIGRYTERWKDSAQTKDESKLVARMQNDEEQIVAKYGRKGFGLLRTLIMKNMDAQTKEIDEAEVAAIERQLARILYKQGRTEKLNMHKFPHQRMGQYEALLRSWWEGMKKEKDGSIQTQKIERLLQDKSIITDICNLKVLANNAEIPEVSRHMTYENLVALLAKPILCSSLENARGLLCQEGAAINSYMPLPLKVSRYQRALYIGGLKKFKVIPQHQQDVIRAMQEQHVIRNGEELPAVDLEDVEKKIDGLITKIRRTTVRNNGKKPGLEADDGESMFGSGSSEDEEVSVLIQTETSRKELSRKLVQRGKSVPRVGYRI